jgi:signal transduction histidine kinase
MLDPDLRELDLLAVTSHEMRAPLAAIRGFVDTLQRRRTEFSEREIAEFLDVISAQTDRLIRMADDLVTMTSLDAGNVTLEREPFLLVPALEDLVRALPESARVEIVVAETAPARIETDAMRLGQALTNLLQNALRYAPDGPVVLAVDPDGGDGVLFAVTDEGVGIGPDDLDRVFELFYRTKEGAKTADGSGLGLAITRKMISALGGEVTAASTPGRGSTFTVILPSVVR